MHADLAYIAYLPERLALFDGGNMHLHRRDTDGLHGVRYRKARVGLGAGVKDYAVCPVEICPW